MVEGRRSAGHEEATALPWLLWAGVMTLMVTATTNVLVLSTIALTCWLAAWALGGPRAAINRLVVSLSLVLAGIWAVLAVVIHREGIGGQVVWLLPEWSTQTSGVFGGAVTTAQLHFALARGVQALAVVAIIGLLLQAVAATAWLRLAAATWGRAARALGPLFCAGEAYVAEQSELRLARRSGSPGPGPSRRLSDVVDRAHTMSEDWFAGCRGAHRPARAVVGFLLALGICLWWGTSAISTQSWLDVTGTERSLLALGAFALVGLALHGARLPMPTRQDVVPAVAAVVVAGCWFTREQTGEADHLLVAFAEVPSIPVLLLFSLTVLPVLALAMGGRR